MQTLSRHALVRYTGTTRHNTSTARHSQTHSRCQKSAGKPCSFDTGMRYNKNTAAILFIMLVCAVLCSMSNHMQNAVRQGVRLQVLSFSNERTAGIQWSDHDMMYGMHEAESQPNHTPP